MAVKFKNYTKSGNGGGGEPRSAKKAAQRTVSKSLAGKKSSVRISSR